MAILRDALGHKVRFREDGVDCLGNYEHDVTLVVDLETARAVWRR